MDYKHHIDRDNIVVIQHWMFSLVLLFTLAIMMPLKAAEIALPVASSDVSEEAFARELVPTLLGRRARGIAEIQLIADVSRRLGRAAAARMLMQEQDFVTHWTDLVVNILAIHKGIGSNAHEAACFGEPQRQDLDGGALAAFIQSNRPENVPMVQTPAASFPAPPFNMIDVISSAIELDDLSTVYRTYLFALAARARQTEPAAEEFMRTYLNRDFSCLRCHNRTYSMSNKLDSQNNLIWRRLWSIPANIEKALFGNYSVGSEWGYRQLFRSDAQVQVGNGIVPWGMEVACTSGRVNGQQVKGAFLRPTTNASQVTHFAGIDGVDTPYASIFELEQVFRNGIAKLNAVGLVREVPPPVNVSLTPDQASFCAFQELTVDTCELCHSGPGAAGGLDLAANPAASTVNVQGVTSYANNGILVVPGQADNSVLYNVLTSGAMPLGTNGLNDNDLTIVRNWINGGAPVGDPALCASSHIPEVDPDAALAFQVAVNAVDKIWQKVMGARLTIDHGFARNQGQLDLLWHLTEDVFVPGQWSLQDTLVAIVTSDYFVRKAPIDGGPSPYPMPMVIDPWVEADPTEPAPNDPLGATAHNGPGDLVRRYGGTTLVNATATALGWRGSSRFPPSQQTWPGRLGIEMGSFESASTPGFEDVDFQSLLLWEHEVGVCSKAGRVDTDNDWIDKLVAAIQGANDPAGQNTQAPITLGDAYLVMKDWILQDPSVATTLPVGAVSGGLTEQQALLAILNAELPPEGQVAITDPATSAGSAYLETKLREICGVLLKTPAFMLAGVVPASYTQTVPSEPRLRVCNTPPCTRQEMCEVLAGNLQAIGQQLYCTEGTFTEQAPPVVETSPEPPDQEPPGRDRPPTDRTQDPNYQRALAARAKLVGALCPKGRCAFMPWRKVSICAQTPSLCRNPPVPRCDQKPQGPQSCGALPVDLRTQGVLSVSATNAIVERARGVQISRPGQGWTTLKSGIRLIPGDVLSVPIGSNLTVRDRRGTFGSPPVQITRKPVGKPKISKQRAPALSKPQARPLTKQLTKPKPQTIPSKPVPFARKPLQRTVSSKDRRRVPFGTFNALTNPVYVSIAGYNPRSNKSAPGSRIETPVLRNKANQRYFQSRATVQPEVQRLARRAFRQPPAKPFHRVGTPMSFGMLHESANLPTKPAPPKPIQLSVQFQRGGVQSLFCPGSKALRCTPRCRVALQAPETCSVLGTLKQQKVSGVITAARSGALNCSWQGNKLNCRAAAPRKRLPRRTLRPTKK